MLNLENDYKTLETKEDEHDIHISLVPLNNETSCKYCNSLKIRKKGKKKQFYFDIPNRNKRTGLTIEIQKYFCEDCKKTFQNNLPLIAENQNLTQRALNYIQEQSLNKPFTHLAEEIGMSEGNVRKIFKSYIENLEQTHIFETPKILGIDEIHLAGRARAVFTNIQEKTILNMFKDRNKDTVLKYLRTLDNSVVEVVTMDMWRPYKDSVNNVFPNATVVIDKFHVLRLANLAVEIYRKELRKTLNSKQKNDLKGDRFLLLKRKDKLTEVECFTLSYWKNNFPALAKIYELKEQFFNIYEAKSKDEAYKLYEQFEASLTQDIKHYFNDLIRSVSNWYTEIFNYFDYPVTNAYTEALNSVIRHTDRMGRSYSFETIRAKMLYRSNSFKKPKIDKKTNVSLGIDLSILDENIKNGTLKFSD